MLNGISYVNLDINEISDDINTIFPDWDMNDEKVCIFCPHDDDALIGAAYAIEAALLNNAQVYIFIFCDGDAGYSIAGLKDVIVKIRQDETLKAYSHLGISSDNIIRFGYHDFSVASRLGWFLEDDEEGCFRKVVSYLRELKITRILVPNHYREHIDHTAVNLIGSYYSVQAGDPIVVDWGQPHRVKSALEYSVWADFSPEDSIVNGRNLHLRANRMILVGKGTENRVCIGIGEYASQGEIIKGLIDARAVRNVDDHLYMELYIAFDPRPKLNYSAYIDYIHGLLDG